MIRVANVLIEGRFAGPQNRVLQAAVGLRKRGIETIVVTSKIDSTEFCHRLLAAEVPHVTLDLHRLTFQKSHLLAWFVFFIPELLSLTRTLHRENVDIVHCNGVWQVKSVVAGWLAGKAVVLHLNDTISSPLSRAFFALMRPFCSAFAFASVRGRTVYQLPDSAQTEIIDAPVETLRFDPATVRADREIANAPGVKVLTVGVTSPVKGLEFLAEAAKVLIDNGNDVSFHVVGDLLESQQRYVDRLHAMTGSLPDGRFTFHGATSRVREAYKAADIYVCSSVTEASPMAVWEAMAMGKAIVSTDVGDVARFIEDKVSGFIVPPGDANALAERIRELSVTPELRQAFGQKAREIAVSLLDVTSCVSKHEHLYRQMLA